LIVEGQRYDIGLPEYYLETLQTFSSHAETRRRGEG
jgi:hypothetical protein